MFAIIATLVMAISFVFAPARAELALVLCGGYLMFYLGQMHLPWLSGTRGYRMPGQYNMLRRKVRISVDHTFLRCDTVR
jgi:hypothetical protein